ARALGSSLPDNLDSLVPYSLVLLLLLLHHHLSSSPSSSSASASCPRNLSRFGSGRSPAPSLAHHSLIGPPLPPQVAMVRDSLNSGDVFILETKTKIFHWNGKKSSRPERTKAPPCLTFSLCYVFVPSLYPSELPLLLK